MTDFSDILGFYRTGKLSRFALEAEMTRALDMPRADVIIDETACSSAGTYAVAIIPDMRSGVIKDHIAVDKRLIDSQIAVGKIVDLINAAGKLIPSVNMRYVGFRSSHHDVETSYLECIEFALNSYKIAISDLDADLGADSALAYLTGVAHTLDLSALDSAILSAHTGKDSVKSCVEFVLNHRLLPKIALDNAEDMFKSLNSPTVGIDGKDPINEVPAENEFYARAAGLCDGRINPQYHKDLDPFYLPDTNLNK